MNILGFNDRKYVPNHSYSWPVVPILLPSILIFGFLYFILPASVMSLNNPPRENGVVENIELILLGLATIVAALSAKKQKDLVLYTTAFCLACITAASVLNEINSCEPPYNVRFCIPRWLKYPPFIALIILLILKLINVLKLLKDIIPSLCHPRFTWPAILIGLCFLGSREAENNYTQYHEELIELFAMIFIAVFSIYLYIKTNKMSE